MNTERYRALAERIKREWKLTGSRLIVRDDAPGTFKDLAQDFNPKLVVVSSFGNDKTIYGDPTVNHMFRALHDRLHVSLGAGFDLAGEKLIASVQAKQFDNLGDIVMAEVAGQAEHYYATGEFPIDQIEFINQYLKKSA